MVVADEISQIKKGCIAAGKRSRKGNSWTPTITVLVVGKRHHTRFLPINGPRNYKGEELNLRAGLVIDHTVVHPGQLNFYLQSHDSPLGTARSVHYVVIQNDANYNMKELQDIVG